MNPQMQQHALQSWFNATQNSAATTTTANWVTANWTTGTATPTQSFRIGTNNGITLTTNPQASITNQQPPVGAPREFNKYVNASDLLEEFIRWLGTQKVKQHEVLALPLELFVKWLVINASEADGEEPEVVMPPLRGRCRQCGQFMRRTEVPLHPACAVRYFEAA